MDGRDFEVGPCRGTYRGPPSLTPDPSAQTGGPFEGELDQLPLLGGGGQWKLGGRRVDLGLEGLLGLSGRADAEAFAIGGGGAAVAVDVDLLLIDVYGGPFASMFLGDKLRVYAAAIRNALR